MSTLKKNKDKKVNFEFNKEYIKVIVEKIQNNDVNFLSNSFKEMHPADAADIIEHLNQDDRENLIKLNNFIAAVAIVKLLTNLSSAKPILASFKAMPTAIKATISSLNFLANSNAVLIA